MKNSITLQVLIKKSNIIQEQIDLKQCNFERSLIHSSPCTISIEEKDKKNQKNRTPGKFIAAQKKNTIK